MRILGDISVVFNRWDIQIEFQIFHGADIYVGKVETINAVTHGEGRLLAVFSGVRPDDVGNYAVYGGVKRFLRLFRRGFVSIC